VNNTGLQLTSTPNTLTFYTGGVYPTLNSAVCMRVDNTTNANQTISGDVRLEGVLRRMDTNQAILPRPSTSWDATYTSTLVSKDGVFHLRGLVGCSVSDVVVVYWLGGWGGGADGMQG
jgi:hypothetical protein